MTRPEPPDAPSRRLWWGTPDLDALNEFERGSMSDYLGMRLTEIGDNFLRGTMPVTDRVRQPFGILHGGASVVFAESLGSIACTCTYDPKRYSAVGLAINANHLRAVREGILTGTATAIHAGRTTQVWEIRIADRSRRLSCVARLTMAVFARVSGDSGQQL